jgi:hypothetical protein
MRKQPGVWHYCNTAIDLGGRAGDSGSTEVFGRLGAVAGVTLSFRLTYSETATVMRYTFTKNRTSACLT